MWKLFRDTERQKEIAMLEAQLYRLAEVLGEQRAATRENVQRKQARTGEERDESDNENMSDGDSDDDENDVPYNPKNLPLGWDGKASVFLSSISLSISFSFDLCIFISVVKYSLFVSH